MPECLYIQTISLVSYKTFISYKTNTVESTMEPDDVAANMKDQVTPIEEIQGEDQEKVDRISSLPDELIHHIMSLLPIEDATRTSVLSKRWEFLFLTFPIVEFDEIWFYQMDDDNERGRRMFIQYLRESLSRRHFNLMQKLRISTVFPHDYELNHLVNRYVASALLRGRVQQIHLRIKNPPDPLVCDHYVLPRVIFSSGSSLVTLILEDCQCGVYNKVSFPSLKNLTMRYVHVTNRLVQRMISNSPQIDTLRLEFCHGFDTLKVFNRTLRRLIVCGCNDLFVFEMDTPSLNYFKCNGTRRFFRRINFYDNGPQMRAIECTEISQFKVSNAKSFCSLETLVLAFLRMNAEVFRSILSTFPNVENMELLNSIFVKIPSVLLEKLKMVEMKNCHFSELVGFNAPNLETLKCKGGGRRFCVLSYFGGKGFCSLKTVSLAGYGGLTDQSLRELLSYCFFLEDLNLKSCDSLEHAKVISATLKTLVLHSCFNLLDGEIHAPKLVFFQYVGKVVHISPIISSSNFEAEIHLENTITDVVNDELIKLKKLLRNFGQARVLTISSNYSMVRIYNSSTYFFIF